MQSLRESFSLSFLKPSLISSENWSARNVFFPRLKIGGAVLPATDPEDPPVSNPDHDSSLTRFTITTSIKNSIK